MVDPQFFAFPRLPDGDGRTHTAGISVTDRHIFAETQETHELQLLLQIKRHVECPIKLLAASQVRTSAHPLITIL